MFLAVQGCFEAVKVVPKGKPACCNAAPAPGKDLIQSADALFVGKPATHTIIEKLTGDSTAEARKRYIHLDLDAQAKIMGMAPLLRKH